MHSPDRGNRSGDGRLGNGLVAHLFVTPWRLGVFVVAGFSAQPGDPLGGAIPGFRRFPAESNLMST